MDFREYATKEAAASLRRVNLLNSVADLRAKLDAAKREHEEMANELSKLEPVTSREGERHDHTVERGGLMLN